MHSRMKLADFGLSHGNPLFEFIPFAPGGTPMYEAPEMLTLKNVTSAGDVWALGAIGYELCEMKHMFVENKREAIKEALLKNDIPQIGDRYSDRLHTVIGRMLEKNASNRIGLVDLALQLDEGALLSPVFPSFSEPSTSVEPSPFKEQGNTSLAPSMSALPMYQPYQLSRYSTHHTFLFENQSPLPPQESDVSESADSNQSQLCEREVGGERRYDERDLFGAVMNGDLKSVKVIVECGCDVNVVDEYGMSAIHFAAYRGDIEIVSYLLDHGCDVNKVDDYGVNALHLAAYSGHDGMVRYLIERGCAVNSVDKYGWNGIHIGTQEGHLRVVNCLIELGCSVNTRNKYGMTALMAGSLRGNEEIIEYLLESGSDVNAKNANGGNAVMIASRLSLRSFLDNGCPMLLRLILTILLSGPYLNL